MDFRIIGDWLHVLSFILLIVQIKKTRHLKSMNKIKYNII